MTNVVFINSAEANDKNITVGLSLLYTGPLGGTASGISDGFLDHMMWINNQGGVEYKDPKTGKSEKVKMIIKWEDTAYNPGKSISIYKRFKAAGAYVVFFIGSAPGEAVSASLSRDKILGISIYGAASPRGYRPEPLYYSASSATLVEEYCTMVDWFMANSKKQGSPKFGALVMDSPSWRVVGDEKGAPAYVKQKGGEWVGVEWLPMMVTDTSVQVSRLIKNGADMIGVFGGVSHTTVVVKDMARLGVDLNKVKVICNTPAWDTNLAKLIPSEGEGLLGLMAYAIPTEKVPGVQEAKMVAEWRGRNIEELSLYLRGFAFGYAWKEGLKKTLEKVGYQKLTPTDLRDTFFHLKNVDMGGIIPPLTVKEPDYPKYCSYVRMGKLENGQIKIVSDWFEFAKVEYGRR
jgi:ABC-type branched-subunit amino acid transport system substrate-binding protein